jgi:hypothetical protein
LKRRFRGDHPQAGRPPAVYYRLGDPTPYASACATHGRRTVLPSLLATAFLHDSFLLPSLHLVDAHLFLGPPIPSDKGDCHQQGDPDTTLSWLYSHLITYIQCFNKFSMGLEMEKHRSAVRRCGGREIPAIMQLASEREVGDTATKE